MNKHLLTFYTRTPLHVGTGASVGAIDLPIMRERITHFPVIPSASLKGVLRETGRQHFGNTQAANTRILFGEDRKLDSDDDQGNKVKANAGLVQIMEAKLLAFPVRSLAGCFAWLTCPTALHRFQRDTGKSFTIPDVPRDTATVSDSSELIVHGQNKVVFEEYALNAGHDQHESVASALAPLVADSLWTDKLTKRLAILHDEDFQYFASTCTEVVARIVIDPATRTAENLFNQENIPCETLFYSVLQTLAPRRNGAECKPNEILTTFLAAFPTLQIGGDETTGHGLCTVKHETL